MKKAVIILAHKNPEQLNIFIKQLLADGTTDIYIHINKKCESIIPRILNNARVHISLNNRVIQWGSDDILQAIMQMYDDVFHSGKTYDYIIIRTGQDMLVNGGLDDFLEKNKGKVYIDCFDYERNSSLAKARLIYKWPAVFKKNYEFKYNPIRVIRGARLALLSNGFPGIKKTKTDWSSLKVYHDLWWCALPVEVARYVYDQWNTDEKLRELYLKSLIPEECYISTMIMSSKYRDRIHFINHKSETISFKYKQINNHPPILRMKDIPRIEAQDNCFFARKFDSEIDQEVIDYFSRKISEYY